MKIETAEGVCELVGAQAVGTPREVREAQRFLRSEIARTARKAEELRSPSYAEWWKEMQANADLKTWLDREIREAEEILRCATRDVEFYIEGKIAALIGVRDRFLGSGSPAGEPIEHPAELATASETSPTPNGSIV